jgi:hypothetical protein
MSRGTPAMGRGPSAMGRAHRPQEMGDGDLQASSMEVLEVEDGSNSGFHMSVVEGGSGLG